MSMSPSMVAVTERNEILRCLGHCGNTCGETTCQSDQDVLDGRCTFVLGGENFGMVGIESEGRPVLLFSAQPVKAFDRRVTVSAVFPFAGSAPFEQRTFGSLCKRLAGGGKASTFTPLLTELWAFGHWCLRTLGCLSGRDCMRLDL